MVPFWTEVKSGSIIRACASFRPYRASNKIDWVQGSPGSLKLTRLRHLQIVGHREAAGHALGPHTGEILVRFAVYDSFQRHAPVLHDDANWLLHSQFILLQRGVLVDGPEQRDPKLIVHGSRRKNFNLVVYPVHTFNVFYCILGVGLKRRPHHLAKQGYGTALHAVCDVVEDSEIREHQQFMPNFSRNSIFRFRGNLIALGILSNAGGHETQQAGEHDKELIHFFLLLTGVRPKWMYFMERKLEATEDIRDIGGPY